MASGDLAELRQKIKRIEEAGRHGNEIVSSGLDALDRRLPGRGLRRGSLVEWLAADPGSGATTLALLAARTACGNGGALVVLDARREFCPPAAVRLGIPQEQLIVIHARNEVDNLWALDQSLRSRGVAAVLAWPENFDNRVFRRLQLAAEEGGSLGLFLCPDAIRHSPSWAELRLFVQPLPGASSSYGRRLRIHLLRCRGGGEGTTVDVDIDADADSVAISDRRSDASPVLFHALPMVVSESRRSLA